ncbi:MAG TPA: lamin tail domain-containing protein, partial [Thermoguttaceae bacterium]|nr:lamin tail domain-containing protein [Thermoguttaceae bacterium]
MLRHLRSRFGAIHRTLFSDTRSTARSRRVTGHALRFEPLEARLQLNAGPLVISEFMAVNHNGLRDGDNDTEDWIEIHNRGTDAVDLQDWYLTDDATDLTGWQFPNVTLTGGDSLVVFASGKYPNGPAGELHTDFKLSGSGEYLGLVQPNGTTIESEFAPKFPGQYADVSYGWSSDFLTQGYFTNPTPGERNLADPIPNPTVQVHLSEIMYHPSSENSLEEYIELSNDGFEPVDLTGWQFVSGVQFTFPSITLNPGQYLVVAADTATFSAKYPTVTNVIGNWEGQLSNRTEEIELVDATGSRVDRVTYADQGDWGTRERGPLDHNHYGWIWTAGHDGGGKSLERINPAVSNNYGQNWAASVPVQGTPGAVNSVQDNDIAPIILDVAHYPVIPHSTDPVTVTAQLRDELNTGVSASVYYRNDGVATFSTTPMFDDGLHGDGAAGDGVYVAVLPARAHGTVVEFYVRAEDSTGDVRTLPAASQPTGQQLTNLLYQVDDTFDPNAKWNPGDQPVYRVIMTEAERAELELIGDGGDDRWSNAQMNATFISVDGANTKVRYNIGIRNRGNGSRANNPNNQHINFPHDRSWNGVMSINLNARYTYRQFIGHTLYALAGLAAEDSLPVHLQTNGVDLSSGATMSGSYVQLETFDADYADNHFPNDGGGNIYKAVTGTHRANLNYLGTNPQSYINDGYSKSTNESENDWSDLINLTYVLNNAPDATYVEDVAEVIDVDQWIRWFAIQTLFANRETNLGNGVGDDYLMYSGVDDPRFVLLPHDNDTILGSGGTTGVNDSIYLAAQLPAINRFLRHPVFSRQYHAVLQELIETVFSPEQFDPLLDNALGSWVAQGTIDAMKDFMVARNANVLSQISRDTTISSNLPQSGGYDYTTVPVAPLSGTAPSAETASVTVNGYPADWVPADGAWTLDAGTGGVVSEVMVTDGHPVSYHVPTVGDNLTDWTAIGFNDDAWSHETLLGAAGLIVTEVSTGTTKFVELENVSGAPIDTTGWRVLVNDATGGNINAVGSVAWDLPASVGAGTVLYRTDSTTDNYWNAPILWDAEGPGWVMIVDAGGTVMDFAAWGYTDTQIASMNISFDTLTGITVGDQWAGNGADPGSPVTGGFVA